MLPSPNPPFSFSLAAASTKQDAPQEYVVVRRKIGNVDPVVLDSSSLRLHLGNWGMLGTVVGWGVWTVRQTPLFHVCLHVLLAPPRVLDVCFTALVLWLQYYCTCNYCKNTVQSHIQTCPNENDLVVKDLPEENCKIAYIDDSDDDLEGPQNRGNAQG